jgi:hypothetical protein
MSKITPKNLHYDTTLPPFLARLQASQSARDDRHEFDVARPRKKRDADAEREDEPVYVDGDTGEVVSLEEKMREGEKNEAEKGDEKEGEQGEEGRRIKENMAIIGGSRKKRKMGRVVGGDEEGEGGGEGIKKEDSREKEVEESKKGEKDKGKGLKKVKKIKLSFGDEE